MSKKKKKQKMIRHFRELPHPREVLSNQVSVDIDELIQLIHRVNPTGRTFGTSEEKTRYHLKSALQSYLIRYYPKHVKVIQPSPKENPDLVSFRLSPFNRDACHALISELDEDARSWTLRYIDEIGADPPHS